MKKIEFSMIKTNHLYLPMEEVFRLSFDDDYNVHVTFDIFAHTEDDNFRIDNVILKSEFKFMIKSKEDLEALAPTFTHSYIDDNFLKDLKTLYKDAAQELESKLDWLRDKAEKWISTEETGKLYSEDSTNYIEVDDVTSFHGNYEVDGKQCCQVTIYKNRVREIPFSRFLEEASTYQLPGYARKFMEDNDMDFYTDDEKKKVIRRVVVEDDRGDEYTKVIHHWGGIFYFKNGETISVHTFNANTRK